MSANWLMTGTAGALFGVALASSGVWLPSVIYSQMRWQEFHMLRTFLTASASSAIAMAIFEERGLAKRKPRSPSLLGLFPYDGNIIGGAMVGFGMTLTGACPGTVLVQLVAGIQSAWSALAGAFLGGILYAHVSQYRSTASPSGNANLEPSLTIQSKFGIHKNAALLAYEIACLTVITLATLLGPRGVRLPLHPVLGGLLIGATQATSVLLTGNGLGVSSGYEEVGEYFWWTWNSILAGKDKPRAPAPSRRAIVFCIGILVGAWALIRSLPPSTFTAPADSRGFSAQGFLGGSVMVFGGRLAGGCTSGHGISGTSTLALPSMVSVASMFAGGVGLAAML